MIVSQSFIVSGFRVLEFRVVSASLDRELETRNPKLETDHGSSQTCGTRESRASSSNACHCAVRPARFKSKSSRRLLSSAGSDEYPLLSKGTVGYPEPG